MKKNVKLFLVLVLLMFALPSLAAEEVVATLDVNLVDEDEVVEKEANLGMVLDKYSNEVLYLDAKYPGEAIEEDFSEDIAKFYPKMNDETRFKQSNFLRTVVRLYRLGKVAYEKYKEMMLVPPAPALVLADDEYEQDEVYVYQDVGKPLVIEDFKKVVSYSDEKQDVDAYQAKRIRDKATPKQQKQFQKMEDALNKLEFRKLMLYGLTEDSPFDDKRGFGEWVGDKAKARLVSNQRTIAGAKELSVALQLVVPRGYIVLSEPLLQYEGLQLKLKETENLETYATSLSVPRRLILSSGENAVGYVDNQLISIPLVLKDVNQPLQLEAQLQFTLCGNNVCENQSLAPKLDLEVGKAEASSAAEFLILAEANLPKVENANLKIKSLVVEPRSKPEEGDILRVILESKKSPSDFDVFVNNAEGIKFASPLVRIDGKQIVVRLRVMDTKVSLAGKEFVITARVDKENAIRQTHVAEEAPLWDAESQRLNLSIVLLGVLGGFLLNLMPCVFPVLSLKLLTFTKFGGLNEQKIRSSFLYNVLGIFTAFVILGIMLISLKLFGYAIGWGMQFQNVYFLVFIVFVVGTFLAQVFGWLNFSSANLANKLIGSNAKPEKLSHFLTGLFLVLLATPCTAPYLGTALGFALAGSVIDIVVVLSAIAVGLALPYILLAFSPGLASMMPRPGPWMLKLNRLMVLMLVLTIVWLLSLLYAQTSGALLARLSLYLGLFLIVLFIRKKLLEAIIDSGENLKIVAKVKRMFNGASLLLLLGLVALGMWDAKTGYSDKREVMARTHYNYLMDNDIIKTNLSQGNLVLLRIGADWCLTCKYNDFVLFDSPMTKEMMENAGVMVLDIDWTNYNPQVLELMGKFGRKGLPFYVLYSPRIPDGVVLPEIVSEQQFRELVENLRY